MYKLTKKFEFSFLKKKFVSVNHSVEKLILKTTIFDNNSAELCHRGKLNISDSKQYRVDFVSRESEKIEKNY